MSSEFEVLISGGTVVDGTGRQAYRADVGIRGGRISAIGDLSGSEAARHISAAGAVVCPGFFDMHNHAEGTILSYPQAESFVMQGITTALAGQCGFSPAPLVDKYLMSFWEFRFWPDIEPYMFHEPLIHPLSAVRRAAEARIGLDIDWHGFDEWRQRVVGERISLNLMPLVGHNTIRAQVMGDDHARAPSSEELEAMKRLLRESLAAGAAGLSTGVDYLPGAHAPLAELVALNEVVAEHGLLHAMHWRRTGIRRADAKRDGPPDKLAGIRQAIEIGRETGVKTLIAHIVSGYDIRPRPTAELEEAAAHATMGLIDDAVDKGLDVAFDVIPNADGGVLLSSYLIGPLTPWARQLGSAEALASALRVRDFRDQVRDYLEAGRWYSFQPKADSGWAERIEVLEAANDAWRGRTIAAISQAAAAGGNEASANGANATAADPLETLMDMIVAEPRARVRNLGLMPVSGTRAFLAHPRGMMGSDTFAFDDTWQVEHPPYLLPHPNTYSAVPWFFERYATGSLEDKVHKLTGLPAAWLGIKDRGRVAEGYWGDLVIWVPDDFRARGDYLEPRRYPAGLHAVLVNGEVVVEAGRHTGARPGRVLAGLPGR